MDAYNLTCKIVNYQKKLYSLEINGLKDSNEYNYIIQELKQLIKEEKNAYESLVISEDELENNLNNLIERFNNTDDEFMKSYYKRILSFLSDILSKQTIKNLSEAIINKNTTKINDSSSIINKAFTCLGLIYFSILNEYINNPIYSDIKNKLIEKKYSFSLIYPELEEKMLNYRFNVPSSIYNDMFFEGQLSNIPISISLRILDAQLLIVVEEPTVELVRPNKLKKEEVINDICFIRASITLMSDKTRNNYFEIVDSLLNDKDLQIKENQYLQESVANYTEDVKKVKTLSLGIQIQ